MRFGQAAPLRLGLRFEIPLGDSLTRFNSSKLSGTKYTPSERDTDKLGFFSPLDLYLRALCSSLLAGKLMQNWS